MKYLELLDQIELVEGARDRYAGMLNFLDQVPNIGGVDSVKRWAQGQLDWAMGTLRDADRITWFMRFVKLGTMKTAYEELAKSRESIASTLEQASSADPRNERTIEAWTQKLAEVDQTFQRLAGLMDKEVKKMGRAALAQVAKELEAAQALAKRLTDKLGKTKEKCAQNPQSADCGLNLETLEAKASSATRIAEILAQYRADEMTIPGPDDMNNLVTELTHYDSINYQPMRDYRFGNKPMSVVLNTLSSLEQEWGERQQSTIPHDDPQVDMVLDFGNGRAWFNLHRSYCEKEGAAMGHCGNQYDNMESSDEVLSFRTLQGVGDNGVELWKPHLTFIFDKSNGMLGEMKGRSNTKPTAAYHPYIIALLKQPWVKGILKRAHQHAKYNDFYLTDLPSETARALAEEKPDLMTYKDRRALGIGTEGMDDMELEKVNEMLADHNVEEIEDQRGDDFVLVSWNSIERAYNSLSEHGWPDEYHSRDPEDDEWESIWEGLDDKTQTMIRAYTLLAHTSKVKEYIEWDEDEERNIGMQDLDIGDAVRVLKDDQDDLISMIEENWKQYHVIGMQDDARMEMENLGQYGIEEFEFSVDDANPESEEDDKGVALTMNVDYFFSDVLPKLAERDRGYGTESWPRVLNLYVSDSDNYWERMMDSEGMGYYIEALEPELKKWLTEAIADLRNQPEYQAQRARQEEMRRQQKLALDEPEQPEEPYFTGYEPAKRDDLDLLDFEKEL